MSGALSRRQLLRGRQTSIRPPWSVAEPLFIDQCTRCGDCIEACPGHIIEKGQGGFPSINFQLGECDFCGDCVTHCKAGVLQRSAMEKEQAPWSLKVSIADGCISLKGIVCRSCGEQCYERAISFRPQVGGISLPEIDLSACTGCGACVGPCPVKAVSLKHYTETTREITTSRLEESA